LEGGSSREVWLAERRQGLGGSDVPTLLGVEGAFGDPLSVWASKQPDALEAPANDYMTNGNDLEPVLLAKAVRWLCEDGHDWRLDPFCPALLAHPDHDQLRYSPDGFAISPSETILLEAKVTNTWLEQPRESWLWQVEHGLQVTGLQRGLIVAMTGKPHNIRYWWHERGSLPWTDRVGDLLLWWADHVAGGVVPDGSPVGGGWTAPPPEPVEGVEIDAGLVGAWRAAADAAKVAKGVEDEAKAAVLAAMQGARNALVGGTLAVKMQRRTTTKWDTRRALKDHPDLADTLAPYRTETTTEYPTLAKEATA
jgi:hypothetical protein